MQRMVQGVDGQHGSVAARIALHAHRMHRGHEVAVLGLVDAEHAVDQVAVRNNVVQGNLIGTDAAGLNPGVAISIRDIARTATAPRPAQSPAR